MEIEVTPENRDLFDGFGNGSLHMGVQRDSDWSGIESNDGLYLNLDFHFSDWEALFINVLKFPGWDEYIQGEDVFEHHERNRKKFQENIPQYPLLARILDMYEDYLFSPFETIHLRKECETIKAATTNVDAVRALRKLILGCDEAIKRDFYLYFSCD